MAALTTTHETMWSISGMHTVLLLTCHGELTEADGKTNRMKSRCISSVLKCGVW